MFTSSSGLLSDTQELFAGEVIVVVGAVASIFNVHISLCTSTATSVSVQLTYHRCEPSAIVSLAVLVITVLLAAVSFTPYPTLLTISSHRTVALDVLVAL